MGSPSADRTVAIAAPWARRSGLLGAGWSSWRRLTVAVGRALRKRMVVRGDIWQDQGMRQVWLWAVSLAAVGLLSGCGGKPAQAAAPTDVLVLEVGGQQQPSLRASLLAMGRTVAPGQALWQRSAGNLLDQSGTGLPGAGESGGEQGPSQQGSIEHSPQQPDPQRQDPDSPPDGPPVEPLPTPPESEWVIVKLPINETLIHLSRRYLGDGRRFLEIMKWNGWSPSDTRRLPTGQDVKIKRTEMR
ncbi:MAG: hypothetical protein ACI8UD_002187 [Planctomycetota bacterium]|jgi:hypothetical protein